uniref:Thioredoxin domain-containing protein n=1 Tax=Mus spicilegus TaxID=10103 RepID=A0A8C6I689_MUSSI
LFLTEAFSEAVDAAGDNPAVLDFPGPSCGPCRMTNFILFFSEPNSKVLFLDVDVDDCWDSAANCEVKCMQMKFSGDNKISIPLFKTLNLKIKLNLNLIEKQCSR